MSIGQTFTRACILTYLKSEVILANSQQISLKRSVISYLCTTQMLLYVHMQMLVHHTQISKKSVDLICYSTVLFKSVAMLICMYIKSSLANCTDV